MTLEATKEFLFKCTESSERIERACSNMFVYANGEEFHDPIFLQALEELLQDSWLENLRSDPSFQEVLQMLEENIS